MTITASINGQPWSADEPRSVAELVTSWCPSSRGIAVARNGEVVPRSAWDDTIIGHGDCIEIVSAAAGG